MNKRLLVLLMVIASALGIAAITGCGSSSDSNDSGSSGAPGGGETVDFDFGKAFEATKAKGSADITLAASVNDGKKTQSLAVTGKADFKNGKLDLSTDLGKLLADSGTPTSDGKVQILVDGKQIWLKLPKSDGLALPTGQGWVSLDLQKVIDKFDLKTEAEKATGGEPLPTVKMVKVGTEKIDGVEVTHLKADVTLRELIESVPGDKKQRDDAIKKLEEQDGGKKALDDKLPAEVWVDSDNVLYRVKANVNVDEGDNKGTVDIDLKMSNFGQDVTITPPAESDTFNATDFLLQFADQYKDQIDKALGKKTS
jgi:hypothetical protein